VIFPLPARGATLMLSSGAAPKSGCSPTTSTVYQTYAHNRKKTSSIRGKPTGRLPYVIAAHPDCEFMQPRAASGDRLDR
jgi:hypothetical protein